MIKQNSQNPKVILVTGSSTGFGRLTVETLAREGHTVYASMRDANGKMLLFAKSCSNLQKMKT